MQRKTETPHKNIGRTLFERNCLLSYISGRNCLFRQKAALFFMNYSLFGFSVSLFITT